MLNLAKRAAASDGEGATKLVTINCLRNWQNREKMQDKICQQPTHH